MSFLNWFSSKSHEAKAAPGNTQQRSQTSPDRLAAFLPQRLVSESHGVGRLKRHARREQLYVAIREAMTRAGVLSASYKFKVLSLDQPGNEFLVMMDLVKATSGSPEELAGIEELIAQNAKARFEITVPAVYWRLDERPADKSFLHSREESATATATLRGSDAVAAARAALRPGHPGTARYEPIEADEVAAFKQALQTASPQGGMVATAQGSKTRSGPRSYTLLTGFEETEMPMLNLYSALSNTQYGSLN